VCGKSIASDLVYGEIEMKKKILIGVAAMLATVANFETKAAESSPFWRSAPGDPVVEIVQLTSDSWFMDELTQATRYLNPENQMITMESFEALQKLMCRCATEKDVFLVPSNERGLRVPQVIKEDLVKGFFEVLKLANDPDKAELLLTFAGFFPGDSCRRAEIVPTVVDVATFIYDVSILSHMDVVLPVLEDTWEDVVHSCKYIMGEYGLVENQGRIDTKAKMEIATRCAIYEDQNWNWRDHFVNEAWLGHEVLFEDDARRAKVKSDLFAAAHFTYKRRSNLGNLKLNTSAITMKDALDSFQTLAWAAYKLAPIRVQGVGILENDQRELMRILMMIRILVWRENTTGTTDWTWLSHGGRFERTLPSIPEIDRAFEATEELVRRKGILLPTDFAWRSEEARSPLPDMTEVVRITENFKKAFSNNRWSTPLPDASETGRVVEVLMESFVY
jgi:hypothetical protein